MTRAVDDRSFARVLVALDLPPLATDGWTDLEAGSTQLPAPSRKALALALRLAPRGELRLLHAPPSVADAVAFASTEGVWVPRQPLAEIDTRASSRARALLQTLADRYCVGADVSVCAAAGEASRVVVEEARAWGADLVVLCTSGHGRLTRFFLGSTADRVIRIAPCPVLIVPPDSTGE